ncbi:MULTISPECIES: type II toxin-antitoxin system RelB family antitoxin [unclassified Gemella]|uniref:type II toxin-antitoxin system RelB family antitoxin n=1 Tax=unclassified Gemella TaxID=2624949 RepID=UPI0010744562|nr:MULTISPECIES: DUF6290 family protein [unclassified Gemella]MBF0710168.1 antitoxin [Gemella sp. GL1.1]MBF0746469.1 antitoxin [Gemella sp. 19428wG2_WT2a]NYS27512.1 antitoxin [Gemella sp. GL1]TFU60249.1 antitoxin [Gemella sp. WT2a]
MTTLSFRVSDEDKNLIKNYVKTNNLSLSNFIRESILDRIEDDLKIDEERILEAKKNVHNSETYTFSELFGDLNE